MRHVWRILRHYDVIYFQLIYVKILQMLVTIRLPYSMCLQRPYLMTGFSSGWCLVEIRHVNRVIYYRQWSVFVTRGTVNPCLANIL